jgi:hypothetical protein
MAWQSQMYLALANGGPTDHSGFEASRPFAGWQRCYDALIDRRFAARSLEDVAEGERPRPLPTHVLEVRWALDAGMVASVDVRQLDGESPADELGPCVRRALMGVRLVGRIVDGLVFGVPEASGSFQLRLELTPSDRPTTWHLSPGGAH